MSGIIPVAPPAPLTPTLSREERERGRKHQDPPLSSFIDYTINGLVIGNIYALLAVGLALIFGVANLINFAHGSVYTLGAYIGWAAITFLHTPLPATMAIVFVACAGVGVLIERIGLRPLQGRARIAPLLATIGVSFVLDQIVQLVFSPNPRAVPNDLPDWRLEHRRRLDRRARSPDRGRRARQRRAAVRLPALHAAGLRGARDGAGSRGRPADGRQRRHGQQRRLRHRLGAGRAQRSPGRHVLQPHRSRHELPGDPEGHRRGGDRRRRQRSRRDRRQPACSA